MAINFLYVTNIVFADEKTGPWEYRTFPGWQWQSRDEIWSSKRLTSFFPFWIRCAGCFKMFLSWKVLLGLKEANVPCWLILCIRVHFSYLLTTSVLSFLSKKVVYEQGLQDEAIIGQKNTWRSYLKKTWKFPKLFWTFCSQQCSKAFEHWCWNPSAYRFWSHFLA